MLRIFFPMVMLSASLTGFAGDSEYDYAQTDDPTQTVLATIFLGDIYKSDAFLETLSGSYRDFLNHFVNEGYCTQSRYGNAAARGCRRAQAKQLRLIYEKAWTLDFALRKAEFNKSVGNTNIGTYQFTKDIDVLEDEYRCTFTMLLTAYLNVPNYPILKEFSVDCANVH